MVDEGDDDYSSLGSSTLDPNKILGGTMPDSQPQRGGHILEGPPIRSASSGLSWYLLRSNPDGKQTCLEQERQQRVQLCQQFATNISRSSQPIRQQQASSSIWQQQAQQGESSHRQPSQSASSQEAASSRGRSNAAAANATASHSSTKWG